MCRAWLDTHIHYKIITINITNTSIVTIMYMVVTLKIYTQQFSVYNTELLASVTMLYIKPPELIHLIAASLYPLDNIFPSSYPLLLGNHCSTVSMSLAFQNSTYKKECKVLSFSALFHLASCPQGAPILLKKQDFLRFMAE